MSAREVLIASCILLACKPSSPAPASVSPEPAVVKGSPLTEPQSWLEELGLRFRDGPIGVVRVSEDEAIAELSRRNDAVWPEDRVLHVFGLMWLLLGDEALAVDLEVVQAGMRRGASKPAIAYYDRERIALIDKEATALAPTPLILAHELVHAYQDQQLPGGVFEALAAAPTIDALTATQLALEGHAEFLGVAAYVAGNGVQLESLTPAFFDPGSARLDNPSASFLYERGALAMLHVFRRGGVPAIDALMKNPPASSEQMLHPGKIGLDAPTRIGVPTVPGATTGPSSTVGELTIRNLFSSRIVDATLLARATTGWDGDTITWYDSDDGPVLVWRTVWDREQDVDQFLAAFDQFGPEPASSCIIADGRRVDFVAVMPHRPPADARAIAEALPTPELPPSDGAASTAEAERIALADLGARFEIRDGRVSIRHSGVWIPIPKTWGVLRSRGVPFVRGPMIDGFGDNVIVSATPNLLGFDLEAVEKETLRQLSTILGHTIHRTERRELAGYDAWLVESQGREAGSPVELHQIRAVFFTDTHRVVVTFSALPDRWPRMGPLFESIIEDIERN